MLIPPNQAGVALGLFAFAIASLISIFSGVTLEIAILRGGTAFLLFWVFGWLMAYLIYEEKRPEKEKEGVEEDETAAPIKTAAATPAIAAAAQASPATETDVHGLEAPDDSDF